MERLRLRQRRLIRRMLADNILDIDALNEAVHELGIAPIIEPDEPYVVEVVARPSLRALASHYDGSGGVYVVRGIDGLFKIGSARDPYKRLASLQTGSPVPLEIVLVIPTAQQTHCALEAALHRRLADKRTQGEWFRLSDDDITALQAVAAAQQPNGNQQLTIH